MWRLHLSATLGAEAGVVRARKTWRSNFYGTSMVPKNCRYLQSMVRDDSELQNALNRHGDKSETKARRKIASLMTSQRPNVLLAKTMYDQNDVLLGFKDEPQAEVGVCKTMTLLPVTVFFSHWVRCTVASTLAIYRISLHWPRVLILPRVVHDNRGTDVQIYDYDYDDGLDPGILTHEHTKYVRLRGFVQRLTMKIIDQRPATTNMINDRARSITETLQPQV